MTDLPGFPSISDALKKLESMTGMEERFAAGVSKQAAILHATVQFEAAKMLSSASLQTSETMAEASAALRASIDSFTAASNRGAAQLAKSSDATAQWTKRLTLVTIALFVAAAAQAIAAITMLLE